MTTEHFIELLEAYKELEHDEAVRYLRHGRAMKEALKSIECFGKKIADGTLNYASDDALDILHNSYELSIELLNKLDT